MTFRGSLFVVGVLVTSQVASIPVAQAGESAQHCDASLGEIEAARAALEGLEYAIANARGDQAALEVRLGELASALALETDSARTRKLRAERAHVVKQIRHIEGLLPPIERQAKALSAELKASEHAYIACIEATID